MRIAGAVLCVALLASAGVRAAEPRSAIPWLSQSIAGHAPEAPAAQDRTPDETAAEPGGPGVITVTPLEEVSRDAVGLLSPDRTGFARDLWGPASALRVRGLTLAHDAGGVPEAQALFRRILLAETDPPRGSDAASSVLAARLDRLLEIGALEEAEALIERAGPATPELFRRWFDAGLLLDRADPPCEALRRNPQLSPTLPARVFCLARGGDWNAAEITLALGRELGVIAPEQERQLARFLDPALFEGAADPPPPQPFTALDFLLREAVGLPRPPGALPLAFLHGDLDAHAPMRVRIMAAERLVLAGAVPPALLFEAYRSGAPAASGGVWDRAAAVQALDEALAGDDPDLLGPVLLAADAALGARGLRVAMAQEYAPSLAALDAAALPRPARRALVETLLLGGRYQAARVAAGPAPDPGLAGPLSVAGVTATPPEIEGDLLRAALTGLADRQPDGARETRLAEMLAEGRQGEALLAALELTENGAETDPSALQAALFTLRRAGQDASARKIALQTLLLKGEG